MSKTALTTALMGALDLDADKAAQPRAPAWVHLLPAGAVQTIDRRGPYRVADAERLIATSFAAAPRLPIDENHATDLAAPKGQPAPARGWITQMEAREDGIWGKVEWTEAGRQLVEDRAYRGLSPVIAHDKSKTIRAILRASLVNNPNLRGLTALHQQQENAMDWTEYLKELLGLGGDATDDQIREALEKALKGATEEAAQASLAPVAKALGLEDGAGSEDILAALQARIAEGQEDDAGEGEEGEVVTALQAELAQLTRELNAVRAERARERAEAFIDAEIKRGNPVPRNMRDHYIDRHMADPETVEKELAAMPALTRSGTMAVPPAMKDGKVALNAAQQEAARLLGIAPEDYAKTLAAERKNEEAL